MTRARGEARARGMTLIEVMVSMSVLLIGLLGMMGLQIWGLNSNQGARAHMQAVQLARELAGALSQLPFGDSRLAPTSHFGGLLQADGTVRSDGFTAYAAVAAVPGVTPEAAIDISSYQRRWTVSARQAAGQDAAKVIGVSVVYRERGIPRLKEVVVYVHNVNRGLLTANLAASN